MTFSVELAKGAVSVSTEWVKGTGRGTVLVAHGAGAGMEHPFMVGFTDALNVLGFSTLRFNFPYREQGRRMPGPAAHAILTWRAAVAEVRARGTGPEKPRAEHLPAISVPQLFIEGTNGPFIQPLSQFEDVVAPCQDARVDRLSGPCTTRPV